MNEILYTGQVFFFPNDDFSIRFQCVLNFWEELGHLTIKDKNCWSQGILYIEVLLQLCTGAITFLANCARMVTRVLATDVQDTLKVHTYHTVAFQRIQWDFSVSRSIFQWTFECPAIAYCSESSRWCQRWCTVEHRPGGGREGEGLWEGLCDSAYI